MVKTLVHKVTIIHKYFNEILQLTKFTNIWCCLSFDLEGILGLVFSYAPMADILL